MSITAVIDRLLGTPEPADVVRRYGPQVHKHLQRIFGPTADVDDVYQMVFIEVIRSLPGFEGRAKLSTWIRRITWNVAYQEMRMQYRHRNLTLLDEGAVASPDEPADEAVQRWDAMSQLYDALEQLDPRQRAVVVMHDVEDRTLKTIAQLLGRPLPTVASQLYAGRERLAKLVQRRTAVESTQARLKRESR